MVVKKENKEKIRQKMHLAKTIEMKELFLPDALFVLGLKSYICFSGIFYTSISIEPLSKDGTDRSIPPVLPPTQRLLLP